MNVGGTAITDGNRQAHGNAVEMILKSAAAKGTTTAETKENTGAAAIVG